MASLENLGIAAGPKGEDDIQFEAGSREVEGCLEAVGSDSGGVGDGEVGE